MPGPDRVVMSLFFVDTDCARRCLRVGGGDSRGDDGAAVPKSELVKVTPGGVELDERAPPLLLLSGGADSSERNCSWLAARTSWTLAAQSSRSYSLCNNSLNVNG